MVVFETHPTTVPDYCRGPVVKIWFTIFFITYYNSLVRAKSVENKDFDSCILAPEAPVSIDTIEVYLTNTTSSIVLDRAFVDIVTGSFSCHFVAHFAFTTVAAGIVLALLIAFMGVGRAFINITTGFSFVSFFALALEAAWFVYAD